MAKQAKYDDLNVRVIAIVGVISSCLLFVSIQGATVLYYKWSDDEYQAKVVDVPLRSVEENLREQQAEVRRFGYDAQSDGITVPVEQTFDDVISEYTKQNQPPETGGGSEA